MEERFFAMSLILSIIFATLIGCSRQSVTKKETTPSAATSTVTTKPKTSTAEIAFAHPELPRITCQELKTLLDKKAKISIVDARNTEAWEGEHIPGSCCIPPADSSVDPDTRRDQISAFTPNTLIVLYCD